MGAICGIELNTMEDDAGLEQLNESLRLTIPDFAPECEPKCLLTGVEITIINNIALVLRKQRRNAEAIVLLQMLEKQLHAVWQKKQKNDDSYALVAFNLSNAWEDEGNYREAGEVAARGVHYCVTEGVLYYFPYLLTNEGCNKLRVLEQEKDQMLEEETIYRQLEEHKKLRQAYVIFQACRNDRYAEILKNMVETEFRINICEE